MKKLIILASSLALLGGCAAPGPNHYGSQAYPRTADPGQWQVVSVTPVPLGTGARTAATGGAASTTYSQAPAPQQPIVVHRTPWEVQPAPVYLPQPVYVPHPVYVPQPVYHPRYYYPPVTIGLGFNVGRGWGHHRGWGGHIGTRYPYHWRR